MKCQRCGADGAVHCWGDPSEDVLCDRCDAHMREKYSDTVARLQNVDVFSAEELSSILETIHSSWELEDSAE